MTRKSLIIVDVTSSLKEFRKAANQPELPSTIDVDAVLDCVVDAISCTCEADAELLHLPKRLLCDDFLGSHREADSSYMKFGDPFSLHESPEDNLFGFEIFSTLAQRLGQQLKQQFETYKLYENGELGYEFDGIVDEHAIALRARPGRRREAD